MSALESIFYMIWRGIAIGVLISAPMGPVGMLCIQRTIDKGRRAGFYTGIGAAISDLFYCLLTGFGLSFIEDFIESNQNIIQLVGSVVLIGFSIYLFRKDPSTSMRRPVPQNVSAKKNILGGFLFTFSNPLIIFLIIGLFARFNFTAPEIKGAYYAFGYLFIIAGALGWWYAVTFAIEKVRGRFNLRSMKILNIIIGIVILCFACVGIVTSVIGMTSSGARAASFHPLARYISPSAEIDTVHSNPSDSVYAIALPLENYEQGRSFQLDFKLRNIKRGVSSIDSYPLPDGSALSSYLPPWGLRLRSDISTDTICVETAVNETESLFSSNKTFSCTASLPGGSVFSSDEFSKGISLSDGWNHFRFRFRAGGEAVVLAGNHRLQRILEFDAPDSIPGIVEIILRPGARVEIKDMKFSLLPDPANNTSFLPIEDVMLRCRHSTDLTEGRWRMLDYTINDEFARLGGDYTVAIVRSPANDYEIIYLDGAETGADSWRQGMLKGRLSPTGLEGIYNLEWIDSYGAPVPLKGKAQRESNGIMSLLFPSIGASLRFQYIPEP